MPALLASRVDDLQRHRHRFGPDAAAERAGHLDACAEFDLTGPRAVLRYHDALLWMAAYPDGPRVASRVEAELRRIEAAAPGLWRDGRGPSVLADTGLAGVPVEAGFSIAIVEWLLDRYPAQVELAWDRGATGEALDDLLSLGVLPAERDGRLDERFDMQGWLRFAGGDGTGPGDLRWVLRRMRTLVPDDEVRDLVAERVGLRVRWSPAAPGATRTLARFPDRPLFAQRGDLKRRFDAVRLSRRPLPEPAPLTPAAARELVDVGRAVLAVRQREADPVTYADPRDVTLLRLDRGVDVALFGLAPSRRLPLESYVGYVAARNRVPVAYGGAWIMDRRAEVGVHLFDTFRGGESAYLFAQVLRTYCGRYRVSRFRVDPYQFGADNPDAIRSGAFWFYYRLGFRPEDDALRAVAAAEWRSIRRAREHRTAPAVLRRFTRSPLALELDRRGTARAPDPARLGAAVTNVVRRRFGGDREAARRRTVRQVARLLSVAGRDRWPADERAAFERLCPLVAALRGVDDWPAGARRALVTVMRAKGGPRERDYVLRVQRHARLLAALADLEDTDGA